MGRDGRWLNSKAEWDEEVGMLGSPVAVFQDRYQGRPLGGGTCDGLPEGAGICKRPDCQNVCS